MITQWYVDQLINNNRPLNNWYPWKDTCWEFNSTRKTHIMKPWRPALNSHITGDKTNNAKLRSIGTLSPRESHTNIMLFLCTGNNPEMFYGHSEYSFLDCLPENAIKWLAEHPSVHIVILEAAEVKLTLETLQILKTTYERFQEKYNIKNKILIQTCSPNGQELYSDWDTPDYIQLIDGINYMQVSIPNMVEYKDHAHEYLKNIHNPKVFTKKVLNYNGRWRLPRAILHSTIKNTIPPEDLIYSYRGRVDEWQLNIDEETLLKEYDIIKPIPTDIRNRILEDLKGEPSGNVLNFNTVKYNSKPFYRHFPNEVDYGETFCEVLAETRSHREYREIRKEPKPVLLPTEKIFKPIAARRPFLVLSNGGMLTYLKSLGLKTYDKWFDESYDDPSLTLYESIDIINKNLEMINSKSYDELMEMYQEMKPILLHNYKTMLQYIYHEPKTHLINIEDYCNEKT